MAGVGRSSGRNTFSVSFPYRKYPKRRIASAHIKVINKITPHQNCLRFRGCTAGNYSAAILAFGGNSKIYKCVCIVLHIYVNYSVNRTKSFDLISACRESLYAVQCRRIKFQKVAEIYAARRFYLMAIFFNLCKASGTK